MKKNTKIFLIIGVVILALIVILKLMTKDNTLSKIKYDIVVQEHYNQYESNNDNTTSPLGGYSTFYTYIVINSETMEKYTITYQDIWNVHNEKGDVDTISIETTTISDSELQDAIDNYGKLDQKAKLKDLLDKYIHEDIIIKDNN